MNKISFAFLLVSIVWATVNARPQRPPQGLSNKNLPPHSPPPGLSSEIEARDVENVIHKLEAVDEKVVSQLDCSACVNLCRITHLPACYGCCW